MRCGSVISGSGSRLPRRPSLFSAPATNGREGRPSFAAAAADKKSPEETEGGDKACLTLSEHCDIPPPNVRVWRNW